MPERTPTMNGVGAQQISIIDGGRTGMKVYAHSKGYIRLTRAWTQPVSVLQQMDNGQDCLVL